MTKFFQGIFFGNLASDNNLLKTNIPNFFISNCLKSSNDPFFVYTGTGHFEFPDFSDIEISNLKKHKHIIVYLYEPTSCYIDKFNRGYYSEFKSNVELSLVKSAELDSIEKFGNKHELNFKVYTGDYNIQLISNNYPTLSLHCFDLFLREFTPMSITKSSTFSKKFWCGNWRYTLHRHLTMAFICNFDGHYSWHFSCPLIPVHNSVYFDLEKVDNNYMFYMLASGFTILENQNFRIDTKHLTNISVDTDYQFAVPDDYIPESNSIKESYTDSFCCVVTETRFFQPFGNFSEKTLRSIEALRPFILVAPPHTLEYLRTFGFKTFNRWWDESYDAEENHQTRLIKIFNIIDRLQSLSLDQLNLIYHEMQEILEHNYSVLLDFTKNTTVL